MSSSVDEIGGSACGATEGQNSSGEGENVELYADVSEPLRGDLFYIEAALSYYDGGPAGADVRSAWDRITSRLSSEEQRLSPSAASAGNAGLDDLTPLPPDIKEIVDSGDIAWLLSLKENGHCGEGTLERKMRDRRNSHVDRIYSALLSLAGERDEARRERDAWERSAREWKGVAIRNEDTATAENAAHLLAEKQLAEAVGVLGTVAALHTHFREETSGNQADAYFTFIKGEDATWRAVHAFLDQHQSPQSSKGAEDGHA